MKKRNLGVLALSSVLAFGAVGLTLTTLAGCGQQASFGELTVEAVGDQEYGATVDLKPLVRFDGKADETKTVTVTVVTTTTLQKVGGDTGTSVRVIGVGACEVKVACEGKEVSVTFNAVPVIGGINVQPLTYAMVGQTVNLDDLVSVTVTAPVTATADFVAEVVTADTVELGSDGKTLTFKAIGAYEVKLSVPGSDRTAKLEGTVVSQTEGKVRQLLSGIGTNYSALVLGGDGSTVIAKGLHNDNYNVLVTDEVSGSIRFVGGRNANGYFFTCGLTEEGLADVSTITYDQTNTSDWSNYFVNMPFDSTVLDSFELVENEGEDPYLFARTGVDVQNDTLYATLVYGTIFQDVSDLYDAVDIKILPSVLNEVEVVKVELTGVTSDTEGETKEELYSYVLTGIGTTVEPNLEEFVNDPSNEPLPADATAEMSFLATAKEAKNYKVQYALGIINYNTGLPFVASELPSTLSQFVDLAYQTGVTYIDDETMYREALCYLNGHDGAATPLSYGYTLGEDGFVHEYSKDEGGSFVVGDVVSKTDGSTYSSIYDVLYTLNDYMDGYSDAFVTSSRESDGTLTYTIDDTQAAGVLSTLGLIGLASENMVAVFSGLSFTSGATVLNTSTYTLKLDAAANTMDFSAQSVAINFGDGIAVLSVALTISEVGTTVIE